MSFSVFCRLLIVTFCRKPVPDNNMESQALDFFFYTFRDHFLLGNPHHQSATIDTPPSTLGNDVAYARLNRARLVTDLPPILFFHAWRFQAMLYQLSRLRSRRATLFSHVSRESSDVAYAYACIHGYDGKNESDVMYANLHRSFAHCHLIRIYRCMHAHCARLC